MREDAYHGIQGRPSLPDKFVEEHIMSREYIYIVKCIVLAIQIV